MSLRERAEQFCKKTGRKRCVQLPEDTKNSVVENLVLSIFVPTVLSRHAFSQTAFYSAPFQTKVLSRFCKYQQLYIYVNIQFNMHNS